MRQGAAVKLGNQADLAAVPTIEEALTKETDRWVRHALTEALGLIRLAHGRGDERTDAARTLGEIHSAGARERADPSSPPTRPRRRLSARPPRTRSAGSQRWSLLTTTVETLFQGASLASILLLMALGLAIVFGLMGVINMAHGELMALAPMPRSWCRTGSAPRGPTAIDFYFVAALPISFLVAAAVGAGPRARGHPLPLRTPARDAAAHVGRVAHHPAGTAPLVRRRERGRELAVVALGRLPGHGRRDAPVQPDVHHRPRKRVASRRCTGSCSAPSAGLRIRAVTQNRAMSSCLGVRAGVVDATTFAFGAGWPGSRAARSPRSVTSARRSARTTSSDSFMVVVTGGVGKLAGTILAAAGLGGLTKGIEPALGAVFGKVAILVGVILFLQRRPAGLFATRGRNAEA